MVLPSQVAVHLLERSKAAPQAARLAPSPDSRIPQIAERQLDAAPRLYFVLQMVNVVNTPTARTTCFAIRSAAPDSIERCLFVRRQCKALQDTAITTPQSTRTSEKAKKLRITGIR